MTKNQLKILSLSTIIVTYSMNVFAATTTGTASVNIHVPLSLSEASPLNFGTISPGSVTSSIDESGNLISGDANPIPGTGAGPAIFSVSGELNNSYNISIPPSVSLVDGPYSMGATLSIDNTGSNTDSQSLSGSTDTFNVKGVITIASNQEAGTYTATYDVTISY